MGPAVSHPKSTSRLHLLWRRLRLVARSSAAFVLVCMVRFYQVGISPLLIGTCKFCPSCSEYFVEAVDVHGPWKGGWLGARRLLRCHPFSPGGIDPVPPRD
ncbi:MAG: membrane protein insertion efficiency factor YidD [Phycisphaerales bacterium]|nr:MAG: membrane protein insertion efficiency factor YidD [Phycisphaerales bacterium]